MRSKLALSVLAGLGLAFAQPAAAARDFNALLDGEYMLTGFASCITSASGFNAALQALPPGPGQPPASVNAFSVQGTRVFHGDGTGIDTGISVFVNIPNQSGFGGGAGSSSFTGTFTYTVEHDLTVTIHQAPFASTSLTGSGVGTVSQIAGVPDFKGRISEDLRTIIMQHETPAVETITTGGVTRYRICNRERTATKVKHRRHDD